MDYDPRLVDLYDLDNPDGPDHDFYRALVDRVEATSVLDLGCGTGILTVTLAALGRTVVGVDPSKTMLDYARRRPGAERVRWVLGDSQALPDERFQVMVMTGNAVQHISDSAWERTLHDLSRVAAPGATLAFETRNPAVRAWEEWVQIVPTVRDTLHGPLEERTEITELDGGRIHMLTHSRFLDVEETVVQEQTLVFRDLDTLTAQLNRAGFKVTAVWGDWHETPFDGSQPLMIVVVRAASRAGSPASTKIRRGDRQPQCEAAHGLGATR